MTDPWAPPHPPEQPVEERASWKTAMWAAVAICVSFAVLGWWSNRDEKAEPPATTERVVSTSTTIGVLDDTTIQIMAIDGAFNGPEADDVCGNPAMDAFTDAQLVALFEEGFGEKLTPAAAEYLVNRVRSC